jgi:tRNA-dihydrouridine synthase B
MMVGNLEISGKLFLAPMAGITDMPFRLLCREQGCGMAYTEMISAKGLYYGSERTEELLEIHPDEHPVGVQLFGSDPSIVSEMARKVSDSEVDLIDINMGCPAPKIVKNCEGSSLMRNPQQVRKLISAVVKAVDKPVTVKIRKGWDDLNVNAVEIALIAEEAGADAVTVHGRTREQFYSGQADWNIICKVKEALTIPVIGNGDIFTPQAAERMFKHTGCDAIMIARGAQGNPWIFKSIGHYLQTGVLLPEPTIRQKIAMVHRHLDMVVKYKGEQVGIPEMRKHIGWYLKGMKDSSRMRSQINSMKSVQEIHNALDEYLSRLENS